MKPEPIETRVPRSARLRHRPEESAEDFGYVLLVVRVFLLRLCFRISGRLHVDHGRTVLVDQAGEIGQVGRTALATIATSNSGATNQRESFPLHMFVMMEYLVFPCLYSSNTLNTLQLRVPCVHARPGAVRDGETESGSIRWPRGHRCPFEHALGSERHDKVPAAHGARPCFATLQRAGSVAVAAA